MELPRHFNRYVTKNIAMEMSVRIEESHTHLIKIYTASVLNLSLNGICFMTEIPVLGGHLVDITLSLKQRTFELNAATIWMKEFFQDNNKYYTTGAQIHFKDGPLFNMWLNFIRALDNIQRRR